MSLESAVLSSNRSTVHSRSIKNCFRARLAADNVAAFVKEGEPPTRNQLPAAWASAAPLRRGSPSWSVPARSPPAETSCTRYRAPVLPPKPPARLPECRPETNHVKRLLPQAPSWTRRASHRHKVPLSVHLREET